MSARRNIRFWLLGVAAGAGLTSAVAIGLWALNEPLIFPGHDPQPASFAATTSVQPLQGPWVVAVQPGHWEIDKLPRELARLRDNTGAVFGSVREVDINKAVAAALVAKLDAAGWKTILVPATVPPELRADAFIAIHADSTDQDPARRGWKLSSPWRASADSRTLAASLKGAFSAVPELVEDADGVTVNMRGYFAFNYRRFVHSISPYTPAVIIELGFISNATDRALLTARPDFWADIILKGIESYFASFNRKDIAALRPLVLPWVAAGAQGVAVRSFPSEEAGVRWMLGPGTVLLPVDVSGSWYEVFVRRHFATGWVRKSDVVVTADPHWPMPGEHRYEQPGR